jgi:hypothetical protein
MVEQITEVRPIPMSQDDEVGVVLAFDGFAQAAFAIAVPACRAVGQHQRDATVSFFKEERARMAAGRAMICVREGKRNVVGTGAKHQTWNGAALKPKLHRPDCSAQEPRGGRSLAHKPF